MIISRWGERNWFARKQRTKIHSFTALSDYLEMRHSIRVRIKQNKTRVLVIFQHNSEFDFRLWFIKYFNPEQFKGLPTVLLLDGFLPHTPYPGPYPLHFNCFYFIFIFVFYSVLSSIVGLALDVKLLLWRVMTCNVHVCACVCECVCVGGWGWGGTVK